jgi:carbonic anhydrase
MDKHSHGLIDNWLRHVQDVERAYEARLGAIPDPQSRANRLCEFNVIEQVRNVARTTIVQDAWRRGHAVQLHGWIYGLRDGLISDLGVQISD